MHADRSSQSSNSGSSKLRLMAVLIECSECLIYQEEFYVGNEVRGLSCAHNLLVDCIDDWLRLNVKCP
ncbi:hypothetical protein Vadar_018322 [Vaccinium darrowii]|uniref:Uncharacterized protein n=1 Tax=Vaccinium darrowii TaxID=229202 RepID=A0ACB7XRI7_9ERIC|nr:hypothetical protein Vadar_018322 [Vaccinium darrowii]